jgi:hypothetical protein
MNININSNHNNSSNIPTLEESFKIDKGIAKMVELEQDIAWLLQQPVDSPEVKDIMNSNFQV